MKSKSNKANFAPRVEGCARGRVISCVLVDDTKMCSKTQNQNQKRSKLALNFVS